MNFSRLWREILGGPENFGHLGLLECISCILEQELRYLNRTETQITTEITQNSGKLLLFFMNKSWPIQGLCFVANVSHVSPKI